MLKACAGAGEAAVSVCIDLRTTDVSAFHATICHRDGQGQPKASPHCEVHDFHRQEKAVAASHAGTQGRAYHLPLGSLNACDPV